MPFLKSINCSAFSLAVLADCKVFCRWFFMNGLRIPAIHNIHQTFFSDTPSEFFLCFRVWNLTRGEGLKHSSLMLWSVPVFRRSNIFSQSRALCFSRMESEREMSSGFPAKSASVPSNCLDIFSCPLPHVLVFQSSVVHLEMDFKSSVFCFWNCQRVDKFKFF